MVAAREKCKGWLFHHGSFYQQLTNKLANPAPRCCTLILVPPAWSDLLGSGHNPVGESRAETHCVEVLRNIPRGQFAFAARPETKQASNYVTLAWLAVFACSPAQFSSPAPPSPPGVLITTQGVSPKITPHTILTRRHNNNCHCNKNNDNKNNNKKLGPVLS